MSKTPIAVMLAGLLSLPAFAADTYTSDGSHTYPAFEVSHLGFSIARGRFDKTSAKISLDRGAKNGELEVSIETGSITTGWPKRDDHLRGEDFFNVSKFPVMTYRSKNFRFDGDKLVGVDGELTLLGVTKPVALAVTGFRCGPHPMNKKELCGADATASIKRSDFGMKYGLPAIGDEVRIAIGIEAFKN